MAIPDRLELDISALEIGDQVRVSDIVIPDGVTLLDDPDAVAATVAAPRVEVIEEEVPEEIEGEEPEEPGAEVEAAGDEQASADTGES
jgi:large subunit ribosomal protein L25